MGQIGTLTTDLRSRDSNSVKDNEELAQLKDAVKRMSILVQEKDEDVRQRQERLAQLEAQLTGAHAQELELERLRTDLDRLKQHLVQVEENYITELSS